MFSIADLLRGTGIDLTGCENIYADIPILSTQATTDDEKLKQSAHKLVLVKLWRKLKLHVNEGLEVNVVQ